MSQSTPAEVAAFLAQQDRAQANQCVAAMQGELDLINRWRADPCGLRAHNLNSLARLIADAQCYLYRAEALEQIKP